jgi:enoyl-CoA hydratase/carnithine racemase
VIAMLDDYKARYEHFAIERRDGILQVTLHSDGDELVWDGQAHREAELALADVGADPENKVVILTGAGEGFIRKEAPRGDPPSAEVWGEVQWAVRRLMMAHLDIQVPMIAAVNGPATIHADLALLCDIVLASETASFADVAHFPASMVPGDGVHVLWPMLLGPNRARYYLLTGKEIPADEAQRLGLVAEVLPRERLLARAWELAEWILTRPPLVRRLTREAITLELRRAMTSHLGYGAALEGLAATTGWTERGPSLP